MLVVGLKGTEEYLVGENGLVATFADDAAAEAYCKEAEIDLTTVDIKDEKEMKTFDIATEKTPEKKKLDPSDQNIIDTFLSITEKHPNLGDAAKAMLVADKCGTSKSYVYAVLNEWTNKEN